MANYDYVQATSGTTWSEAPTSLSESASSLEALQQCAGRLALTAGELHAARQRHDAASKEFMVALDRLAKAREQEGL